MIGKIEGLFKEGGKTLTEFNPFNHGSTSIEYIPVNDEVSHNLTSVLQSGWGISPNRILQVKETIFFSNNYPVILPDGSWILLKHSNSPPNSQRWIDDSIKICHEQGIPTVQIISTIEDETLKVVDGQVYQLHQFVPGEHFDGSQEELVQVAAILPKFFQVLETLPFFGTIKDDKGDIVSHDLNQLQELLRAKKFVRGKYKINSDSIDLIAYSSNKTAEMSSVLQNVPRQIVHRDFHPHNILYSIAEPHIIEAVLDFEGLAFTQRVRGIAFTMHRFARTYGNNTERKQDSQTDITYRMKRFLKTYLENEGILTDEEIKLIPLILFDNTLVAITNILRNTLAGKTEWIKDIDKQISMLKEIETLFYV